MLLDANSSHDLGPGELKIDTGLEYSVNNIWIWNNFRNLHLKWYNWLIIVDL